MELLDGLTYWMFRAEAPTSDTLIASTDFALSWFGLAAALFGTVCTGLLLRRYQRVQA